MGEETSKALRHPELGQGYFFEFLQIREHILNEFDPCISFDSFFDPTNCPAFDRYTKKLIQFAHGRPLLQCCRSYGRVGHLKRLHAGVHIHLWRNPWDQWWSFQISDYFNTANLLILNAENLPPAIAMLRAALGLGERQSFSGFDEAYQYFYARMLNPKSQYFLFYGLWLFSLMQNRALADIDINLDRLSSDIVYESSVITQLNDLGVTGVDLSGCNAPLSSFSTEDQEFFEPIEQQVHELFKTSGCDPEQLSNALEIRRQHEPLRGLNQTSSSRDGARARSIALRYATSCSDVQHELNDAKHELNSIKNSRMWRYSRPLRAAFRMLRRLYRD